MIIKSSDEYSKTNERLSNGKLQINLNSHANLNEKLCNQIILCAQNKFCKLSISFMPKKWLSNMRKVNHVQVNILISGIDWHKNIDIDD